MLNSTLFRLALIALLIPATTLSVQAKTFIRDYTYHGDSLDTAATCRVNAIDAVKRELVEELGTYVQSVIRVHQDQEGNSYQSQDMTTISAGITSLKVLNEKWNKPRFYIKASLQADPDDVMKQVNALRNNVALEQSLRESQQALNQSRQEIKQLREKLAGIQNQADHAQLASAYKNAVDTMAVEQAFQNALAARINGNFVAAMDQFKGLAQQGIPRAELLMGVFYERGLGVAQDYPLARQWYDKAAKGGDINAPARIGWMYEHGFGVDKDYKKAAEYYRTAMKLGSPMGFSHMGFLYQSGKGVPHIPEQAAEYYQTAMQRGDYLAMAYLGILYNQGNGVSQDPQKAVELFQKASAHGQPVAMAMLGYAYDIGLGGLPVDPDKGIAYIRGAAHYHLPIAYAFMGLSYENGYGVESNYEQALYWYKKGAELDAPMANFRLGIMYLKGYGVDRDPQQARRYLERAKELGFPKAQTVLERMDSHMGGGGFFSSPSNFSTNP